MRRGADRTRLDLLLVSRGLAASRDRAQALIRAGRVLVDERVADKPGAQVADDAPIRVRGEDHPYVSRGGLKLAAALDAFGVDPAERTCADLGASTGGFTDCLLQRGAARVYAVDVGYGQLAWTLRQDPRVVVLERTNARNLDRLPEPIGLVVGDLSFISLGLVLPAIGRIAAPDAECVLLVKPQFEVGRDRVRRGGRVADADRAAAIAAVRAQAAAAGWEPIATLDSPVPGARAGNVEALIHLRRSAC